MKLKDVEEEARQQVELEALRRQGMRWAVLLSLRYALSDRKANLPPSVNRDLRLARAMLESGCFSICDVNCLLDEVERVLFQEATSLGESFEGFDGWLYLLGKAMKGQLTSEEVGGLPFIKPIVQTCNFLKCACER